MAAGAGDEGPDTRQPAPSGGEEERERRHPPIDESELDRICLHNLLSACTDNIYFKDRDSRFLRASDSTAAVTSAKDPAAMIGRPMSDYFTAEHADATLETERMIMRT